jgi:hypothetical protein
MNYTNGTAKPDQTAKVFLVMHGRGLRFMEETEKMWPQFVSDLLF